MVGFNIEFHDRDVTTSVFLALLEVEGLWKEAHILHSDGDRMLSLNLRFYYFHHIKSSVRRPVSLCSGGNWFKYQPVPNILIIFISSVSQPCKLNLRMITCQTAWSSIRLCCTAGVVSNCVAVKENGVYKPSALKRLSARQRLWEGKRQDRTTERKSEI